MNKSGCDFSEKRSVIQIVENGVILNDVFIQVTPFFSPSTRVTNLNVSPFIPNELLKFDLLCVLKFVSGIQMILHGCKHPSLKQETKPLGDKCLCFWTQQSRL